MLSIRITYCNVGNLPTPKREVNPRNQGKGERSEVESRKKASDSEVFGMSALTVVFFRAAFSSLESGSQVKSFSYLNPYFDLKVRPS